MKPQVNCIYWNVLGRMLKLWKKEKITDSHATKLLRLFVGYEFTDLMDPYGRYPMQHFNEIKRRLGYERATNMLDDVKRSKSFWIVGTARGEIMAICSPLWHGYEAADGNLLGRADYALESRICDSKCDGLYINNYNTTVGNSDEFAPQGGEANEEQESEPTPARIRTEDDALKAERDKQAAMRIVSDYFDRLQHHPDMEQHGVMDDLLQRCMHPRNSKGQLITDWQLDEEHGRQLMNILIRRKLVPYFAMRQDFFKQQYMQHPEKRIWWISAFLKRYVGGMLIDARKIWQRNRQQLAASTQQVVEQAERQYRPLSPHEWQDADGNRWYDLPSGQRRRIASGVPPRPSATSSWNFIRKEWEL